MQGLLFDLDGKNDDKWRASRKRLAIMPPFPKAFAVAHVQTHFGGNYLAPITDPKIHASVFLADTTRLRQGFGLHVDLYNVSPFVEARINDR